MRKPPRDLAASVRQRLLNLAQAHQEDFGYVLTRYALERLLYRLSCSAQRERLVLKGALLFQVWSPPPNRRTRDLDLLGQGETTPARFVRIFQDLCRQPVAADGLEFVPDSVRAEPTQQDQVYIGLRVQMEAVLACARIPLQIDIGFGDVITPQPLEITYPTLLDFPAPRLRAYPPETVVAEKFQALVVLGMANSRMKDLYDLWVLARQLEFSGVEVELSLFFPKVLVRRWGRIGTRRVRSIRLVLGDAEEVREQVPQVSRLRHGYGLVAEGGLSVSRHLNPPFLTKK